MTAKYKPITQFKPFAELLAFAPNKRDNEQSRLMKENAKIAEENFIRRRDQGVTNIDLEYKGDEVIHNNNARIEKLQAEYGFDPFTDGLKVAVQGVGFNQQLKTQAAYEDLSKLKRIDRKAWQQLQDSFRSSEKAHNKNIEEGSQWAWKAELSGESQGLVDRILTGTGFYGAAVRSYNLGEAVKHFPGWIQNQHETKYQITDKNFTGEISEKEYNDALTSNTSYSPYVNSPLQKAVYEDFNGDKSLLGAIQDNMRMTVYGILSDPDGYFRYNENTLTEHFDPLLDKLFDDKSIDLTGRFATHSRGKIKKAEMNLVHTAITNPYPGKGVQSLISAANMFSMREGGHKVVFQNYFDQIIQGVRSKIITVPQANQLLDFKFDPKELEIKGFENYKGKISLREWRKDDLEAVDFDVEIHEALKAVGVESEQERQDAVTLLQGSISSHRAAHGEQPAPELIREMGTKIISELNGAGGITLNKLVLEATKDTGSLSTLDAEKGWISSAYMKGGPVSPEAMADKGISLEGREWAKEKGYVGKSIYEIPDALESNVTEGVSRAKQAALSIKGNYDQPNSQYWMGINGERWIRKEFKLRKLEGDARPAPKIIDELVETLQKDVIDNPEKWMTRIKTKDQTNQNFNTNINAYNNNRDSTVIFPTYSSNPDEGGDGRWEYLAAQLLSNPNYKLTKDSTFISARDNQRYKIYDSGLRQLSNAIGIPMVDLVENQLLGTEVKIKLNPQGGLASFTQPSKSRTVKLLEQRGEGTNPVIGAEAAVKTADLQELGIPNAPEDLSNMLVDRGIRVHNINPNTWEELTGIDFTGTRINQREKIDGQDYRINYTRDAPVNISDILYKLGIKRIDKFEPAMVKLIQKRVIGLYGPGVFPGAQFEGQLRENGTYQNMFMNPKNLYPGLAQFGTEVNVEHFPNEQYEVVPDISYASDHDTGTRIGTTKLSNNWRGVLGKKYQLVFTVVSGESTGGRQSVKLGWKPLNDERRDWVKKLAQTNGNPFGFKTLSNNFDLTETEALR